ncbi:L,D-transpeptidase family protein [Hyphomicrobium sp.]|uniref:L,D-transpeptidase family protein n=1 Tax=Hyphomicrobium sp. TaxID=82 RepID=UPI003F71D10E
MPLIAKPQSANGYVPAAARALTLAALAAVLVAGPGLAPPHAAAQGLFGTWDDAAPPAKPPRKAKRRVDPAASEDDEVKPSGKKKGAETAAGRAASGPLVINVSLSRQRLVVYDANGPIAESPVSSGRVGYGTPAGVYSIVQKKRQHYSNLYAGASMPNMQRITWSGVALHAGALPGYPASHGCIRLPHGFSGKLFGLTSMGTRVIVSRDPVTPVPIAHDRLFAAFPPEPVATATANVKVADASGATGGSPVSQVLGVSAAVASETPEAASPRSAYRERRRLEMEALNGEIRQAGYDRAEKTYNLAQTQKAAAAARPMLAAARADADKAQAEMTELEQAKARADREIADLEKPDAPPVDREERKSKKTANKTAKKSIAKKTMDPAAREARIAELKDELKEYPALAEAARIAWASADAVLKAAQAAAAEADAKRTAAMNELAEANNRLQRGLSKELAAKRMEQKRNLPVSVLVSRSKKRLYVRQGYEDMFDVEVAFDNPDEPIGTHVFTALAYNAERTGMQWSVASIAYDKARDVKKSKKDKTAKIKEQPAPVSTSHQTAAAALDRVTIPEDVREQIADVMKPGSSLIISDTGIGNETGEYTDFIVPLR